jgi:hypothetical protein
MTGTVTRPPSITAQSSRVVTGWKSTSALSYSLPIRAVRISAARRKARMVSSANISPRGPTSATFPIARCAGSRTDSITAPARALASELPLRFSSRNTLRPVAIEIGDRPTPHEHREHWFFGSSRQAHHQRVLASALAVVTSPTAASPLNHTASMAQLVVSIL